MLIEDIDGEKTNSRRRKEILPDRDCVYDTDYSLCKADTVLNKIRMDYSIYNVSPLKSPIYQLNPRSFKTPSVYSKHLITKASLYGLFSYMSTSK